MAKRRICDRCKEICSCNKNGVSNVMTFDIYGYGDLHAGDHIDLCEDCYKEFVEWFMTGKKEPVGKCATCGNLRVEKYCRVEMIHGDVEDPETEITECEGYRPKDIPPQGTITN